MPRTTSQSTQSPASKPLSSRAVAVQILKRKRRPMKVSELAAAVVASGKTRLAGKTPRPPSPRRSNAAKAGKLFEIPERGTVTLKREQ